MKLSRKMSGLVFAIAIIVAVTSGLFLYHVEPGLTVLDRRRVVAAVSSALNDPYSAHFTFAGWVAIPKTDEAGHVIPKDGRPFSSIKPGENVAVVMLPRRWYCGRVNAKNQFGAYTGFQDFAADTETGTALVGHDAIGTLMDASPDSGRTVSLANDQVWSTCSHQERFRRPVR